MPTVTDAPDAAPFPAAAPLDEHNRRLLSHVHPADWVNPTPKERYHLVVIGAGTGGLVTAAIGAALGARVALVERHLMGGDCLNVGCVPSKAVIRASRAWADARGAAERFSGPASAGDGDFAAVMERMRRLRAGIAHVDGAPRFRDLGVDVFLGDGRFTSGETVEVAGATLRFRRAVVATGARAAVPPIPGLAEAGYLTNETVFSLTERPEALVVIGGGPIGCELAQAFARLGSRVTLLQRAPVLLQRDDPDAAEIVAAALRRDGVRVETGVEVRSVAPGDAGKTVRFGPPGGPDETVDCTHVLVAAGRAANVEGMGLERAGIAFDAHGVRVDDRMRTSNPAVYAVGDVASRFQFTHAADAQARLVVQNALFFGRGKASSLVIPWATYTSPEVAHVGIAHDEAMRMGDAVETVTVPLHDVDRARLDGEDDGFFRVHLKRGTDRILGATLVSPHAGDIISQVTQAMTNGLGLSALGRTVYPYPTQAEVLRKAADARRRQKLTPTAKKAFSWFFRAVR